MMVKTCGGYLIRIYFYDTFCLLPVPLKASGVLFQNLKPQQADVFSGRQCEAPLTIHLMS
jgi:hypothetical protein